MEAAKSRLSGLEDTQSNWKSMGLPDSAVPKSFQEEVREAEQAIRHLQARMEALQKEGGAFNTTKEMQNLSSRIQEAREKLSQYNTEMKRMQASGKDVGSNAWNNLQSEISRTEQRINSATRSIIPRQLLPIMSLTKKDLPDKMLFATQLPILLQK